MANLLDAAIASAESELNRPRQPSPSELKRATELVGKLVAGQSTWTDRIVLENLLSGMGTSMEQVMAAVQDEIR